MVSLAATPAMTPRPNCACLPVMSSSVLTVTRVTDPSPDIRTSTVADAVPLPRVSRPLPCRTSRCSVSSLVTNRAVPA